MPDNQDVCCKTCWYFNQPAEHVQNYTGECRRHAPQVMVQGSSVPIGTVKIASYETPVLPVLWPWPIISEDQWCGDYKASDEVDAEITLN